MAKGRRFAVWFIELIVQAALLMACLFLLIKPAGNTSIGDLISLLTAIVIYLCMTGFALTTAISRIYWSDKWQWTYPAFSAGLFFVHFELFNQVFGGKLLDDYDRFSFIVCGICISFSTTLLGSYILRRWSAFTPV